MGPIDCPETSVRNYHSTLRKIQKRSHGSFTQRRQPQVTHPPEILLAQTVRNLSLTLNLKTWQFSVKCPNVGMENVSGFYMKTKYPAEKVFVLYYVSHCEYEWGSCRYISAHSEPRLLMRNGFSFVVRDSVPPVVGQKPVWAQVIRVLCHNWESTSGQPWNIHCNELVCRYVTPSAVRVFSSFFRRQLHITLL